MSKIWWIIGLVALAMAGFLFFNYSRDFASTALSHPELKEYAESQFQNWHEFSAPLAKFKVLVPVLPQHGTDTLNDPKTQETRKYDIYVSEKDDGTIFMISMITMMNGEAKLDKNTLTTVMNDILAASPNNKLKIMKMGTYKQYPALDFSIENDQVNIDGKAFLVGNTLYLLTSVAKIINYKKQEFEFFVNSFQLSNQSGAPAVQP